MKKGGYDTMKNETVTRAQISDALRKRLGLTRSQSLSSIDCVLDEITEILKEDKEVKLPLFGVFFSRQKKERMGRNPKTLEEAKISARRVTGFRLSRLMKDRIDMSIKKKGTSQYK